MSPAMPFNQQDTTVYRRDVHAHGRELSVEEREKLLKPYLPPPREMSPVTKAEGPNPGVKRKRRRRQHRIRPFIKAKIHTLVYFLIHLFFGIYIRLRQIYHATVDRILAILYYHHRTPE